jgi:hypothetical protein
VQNYANNRTVPNLLIFEFQILLTYLCAVNAITRISIIAFVLFAFVGNIGIRVFTHSCSEDGIFRSYFIENQSHCKDDKVEKLLPPCCQKNQKTDCGENLKEDCCTDEVDVFKITFDYFSWEKIAPQIAQCQNDQFFFASNCEILANPGHQTIFYDPPPKPAGKKLLQQICTYLI